MVGGQEIKAGDKVVMFYNSANRDERKFDDPYRVRPPPHAERARRLRRRRPALLPRREPRPPRDPDHVRGDLPPLPDLEITGEPDYLQSAFIHGIKRMPLHVHPDQRLNRSRPPLVDSARDARSIAPTTAIVALATSARRRRKARRSGTGRRTRDPEQGRLRARTFRARPQLLPCRS